MTHRRLRNALSILAAAGLAAVLASPPVSAIETTAREAFLVDATTGRVLLDKNSDVSMPPASMSKIMTTYMVFERLKDGRLSLDDELPVSEKAWRMGGSKMFVEVGTTVRVEDLLRGVIVQSGNDACIVLAEGLGGTEEAFAEEMTRKAREIGLTGSSFANATGWPDPNQRMTARDLATLAKRIIEDFPEYYHYYAETEFTYGGIRQMNRNPLLYKSLGADGLKTGHTEEAGYGLTASVVQGARRIILVLNGLDSRKARGEESVRLIGWAMREYDNYTLFKPGETVDEAPVWLGEAASVPLVMPQGATVTLSRKARRDMRVKVVYDAPIPAPLRAGQEVAKLVVAAPGEEPVEFPLMAGADVERLGIFGRIIGSLEYLVFGAQ
ncbi:MAG: D-alanyl-D-alanine carboxypeptidase [Proteobacteria bacterium]|nr:D-alanyl-D-alanine carboxypeptidase [Pseudomonadota bacterium]